MRRNSATIASLDSGLGPALPHAHCVSKRMIRGQAGKPPNCRVGIREWMSRRVDPARGRCVVLGYPPSHNGGFSRRYYCSVSRAPHRCRRGRNERLAQLGREAEAWAALRQASRDA
jgi:hypothetical protein